MALHAEGVGQGDRDLPPGRVRDARRPRGRPPAPPAGRTGSLRDRSPAARGDGGRVHVVRAEGHAGAEEGVHRALPVGRHQDQAARGGRAAVSGAVGKCTPAARDVVAEDLAELRRRRPCRGSRPWRPAPPPTAQVLAAEPPLLSTPGPMAA